MVIKKETQRIQVRDNIRGGPGRLENRHILEKEQMFGAATLLTEFYFDPGDGIGPHVHQDDPELYYILEGELTLCEDGKETVLTPGDASYAYGGVSHSIQNRSDRPARMLALILEPKKEEK